MRYVHIMQLAADTPWAILPAKLAAIQQFLATKAAGDDIDPADIRAFTEAAAARANPRAPGAVAVIPVVGTIVQRANIMTDMSGGVSTELFGKRMRQLVDDPNVKAIVMDVDSPGGMTSGVAELADSIHAMRGRKPIVAVSNTLMASAAYYIASQADEVIASPSSETGSIGVFGLHQDVSAMAEMLGVRTTLISAGKFKTEGNPFEPLGEEARQAMQTRVDAAYDLFVKAVARGRGVSVSAVRGGYGEGRVLDAKAALAAGMVDRIATLDETIARFGGSPMPQGSHAEVEHWKARAALAR